MPILVYVAIVAIAFGLLETFIIAAFTRSVQKH